MSMPQSYEPYYKLTHYMLGENTRKKLLDIANAPGAFVDISYKISFFKLPSTIQHFNTTGLNCVCQMLRVSESGSTIHKDRNRYNEYDNQYMPRHTVISFALTFLIFLRFIQLNNPRFFYSFLVINLFVFISKTSQEQIILLLGLILRISSANLFVTCL